MSFWNESLNTFAASWLETLIRVCWQGGLALALVWAVCRLLPRLPAWGKGWLWRLAYLKLLFAFLWLPTLDLPLLPPVNLPPATTPPQEFAQAAPAISEAIPVDSLPSEPQNTAPSPSVMPAVAGWLLLLWTGSLLWQSGQAIRQGLTVRRLRLSGKPLDGGPLDFWNVALSRDLNLAVVPRLLSSTATSTPVLIGILRPCIVLPESLLATCTPDELRLILAHELAHVRRRDLLWGWLPLLTRLVCGFHPLTRLAECELSMAQEIACDEIALHLTGAASLTYGSLLVRVATRFAPRPSHGFGMIGMTESYHTLKRRLSAMKSFPSAPRPYRVAIRFGLLTLGLAALLPWRVAAQATPPVTPVPVATPPVVTPPVGTPVQTPVTPPAPVVPPPPTTSPAPAVPATPAVPPTPASPVRTTPPLEPAIPGLPPPTAAPPVPAPGQAPPVVTPPPATTNPATAAPAGRRSAKATKKAATQDPTATSAVSIVAPNDPTRTSTVAIVSQNAPARISTVTIGAPNAPTSVSSISISASNASPRTSTVIIGGQNASARTSTIAISRNGSATSTVFGVQGAPTGSRVTIFRTAPATPTTPAPDDVPTAPQGYPQAAPGMVSPPKPAATAGDVPTPGATRSSIGRGAAPRATVPPARNAAPTRSTIGVTPAPATDPRTQPAPTRATPNPFGVQSLPRGAASTAPSATPVAPNPRSANPFGSQPPMPTADPAARPESPRGVPVDPVQSPVVLPRSLPTDPAAKPPVAPRGTPVDPVAAPPVSTPAPPVPKTFAVQAPALQITSREVPVLSKLPILGHLFRFTPMAPLQVVPEKAVLAPLAPREVPVLSQLPILGRLFRFKSPAAPQ